MTPSLLRQPARQRLSGWRHARRLALLTLAVVLGACGSPRPIQTEAETRRDAQIATPTSSVHYRAYADGDALAQALRWTPNTRPLVSAHRGGPTAALPENSLESFENALNFAPALIEMDVRQTSDGRLVLMHDETVDRTTTGQGEVSAMTFAALRRLRLIAQAGAVTSYRVPSFTEALAWADGRAVLMVDVKREVPMEDVIREIRQHGAQNRAVIIVYTLEGALEVARLAPEMVLSVTARTEDEAREVLASGLDPDRLIAFGGVGGTDPDGLRLLHEAGIRVQVGTFGETDEAAQAPGGWSVYAPFLEVGVDVLATDNVPAASIAVQRAAR